ncbi:MAG: hypothetical protein PHX30_01665 [Candidatus Pacebacteria bacterium]|nr:hypothetical protein [Candidatus Paceibacterota bacterium]
MTTEQFEILITFFGAFFGAFFAFIFMLKIEQGHRNEEIKNALFEISVRSSVDNEIAIDKNISIIGSLQKGISENSSFYYPFGGFCLFQKNSSAVLNKLGGIDLMFKIIDFDYKTQKINQEMNDIGKPFLGKNLIKEKDSNSFFNGETYFDSDSYANDLLEKKHALEMLEEDNIKILVRTNTLLKKKNKGVFFRLFQNDKVTDNDIENEQIEIEQFKEVYKKRREPKINTTNL